MAGVCDYTLVDTREKAETAIKALRSSKLLSVDCEGVNLGRDGELCLLQIAVKAKVYLFDIVTLKGQVFDMGLREILENPSVTKLFYDCRGDCSALQHQYNVVVTGMEDLQLLNCIQMKFNGIYWQNVTGLSKCMDYHLKGCGFSTDTKKKMHKAMSNDKNLWKKRPLAEEFLGYAAADVYYLAKLRKALYTEAADGSHPELVDAVKYASKRYADFSRNNSAYDQSSCYFTSPRLPQKIIPDLRYVDGKYTFTPFSNKRGKVCISCNWRTNIRKGGQCRRCYKIDYPEERFSNNRQRFYHEDTWDSDSYDDCQYGDSYGDYQYDDYQYDDSYGDYQYDDSYGDYQYGDSYDF